MYYHTPKSTDAFCQKKKSLHVWSLEDVFSKANERAIPTEIESRNGYGSVEIKYMYRDGANWKTHASHSFPNHQGMFAIDIERRLLDACDDGGLFVAEQVGLPVMFNEDYDDDYDHGYHEIVCVNRLVNDKAPSSETRSISEFLDEFERESNKGWTPVRTGD